MMLLPSQPRIASLAYRTFVSVLLAIIAYGSLAGPAAAGQHFQRIITVVLENTDYADASRQPFLSRLAARGAVLQNLQAETHPSQGNYIALVSGGTHGVTSDAAVDLDVRHVGDLLDSKGLSWKVYAEQYPGNCFTGDMSGAYRRKHLPFLSFVSIQKNPLRCRNIVEAKEWSADLACGSLPAYALYVPDLDDDGHDTGVEYADRWLERHLRPLLDNPNAMRGTLLVVTFDESKRSLPNRVFTVLVGDSVKPGSVVTAALTHYSLLRLVEDNWALGDLGAMDRSAAEIDPAIWR